MAGTRVAPLDVIACIDTEWAVTDEVNAAAARATFANLSRLTTALLSSGIDFHFVLISESVWVTLPDDVASDPRFRHVEHDCGSPTYTAVNLLDQYADLLRPDAVTHVISVTGNALPGDTTWAFERAIDFIQPHFTHLVIDVVASPPGEGHCDPPTDPCTPAWYGWALGCTPEYGIDGFVAARDGSVYWQLAAATGGVAVSICSDDWSSVFDSLVGSVVVPVPVPCVYTLPDPPEGSVIDPTLVNIEVTSAGMTTTIPQVRDATECPIGDDAWYYDNPEAPTEVRFCEAACERLASLADARINVAFGCATIPY